MLAAASASRIMRPVQQHMSIAQRVVITAARFSTSSPAASSSPTSSTSSSSSSSASKGNAPARTVSSSLPAGTVMTGLSILKDQPDPIALPDDQYPAWLWTILDGDQAATAGSGREEEGKTGEFDFKSERKRLRATNRASIKAANYLKTT